MEKLLRVRYCEWIPWAQDIVNENKTVLNGIMKDIFEVLSYSLKIKFDVQSQVDHNFGLLQANGSFSGMVGALHKKEIDIAGPFVASEERASGDFSNCLEFSKLGLITGVMSTDRQMFRYARVFSWQVWLSLLLAMIAISFVAVLIYNVSSERWAYKNFYVFCRYCWIFWSNLIGHDVGSTRHWAVSTIWNQISFRLLFASWLLGPVMIFTLSFQTAITSTFAVKKLKPMIADLGELTLNTHIIPVIAEGQVSHICFKTSKEHDHLWKRMQGNIITYSKQSMEDTLFKVEKGTHVYITEYFFALGVANEWVKRRRGCSVQVQEILFCKNFVTLVMRRDMPSDIRRRINTMLTYIMQAKLHDRILNRLYRNYTHCTKQDVTENRALDISDFLGGIIIWCIGISISFLTLAAENFNYSRSKKNEELLNLQRIQMINNVDEN